MALLRRNIPTNSLRIFQALEETRLIVKSDFFTAKVPRVFISQLLNQFVHLFFLFFRRDPFKAHSFIRRLLQIQLLVNFTDRVLRRIDILRF